MTRRVFRVISNCRSGFKGCRAGFWIRPPELVERGVGGVVQITEKTQIVPAAEGKRADRVGGKRCQAT